MAEEETITFNEKLLKYGSAFASLLLCTYYLGVKVEANQQSIDANTRDNVQIRQVLQEHTLILSKHTQDIRELQLYRELSLPYKTK